MLRLRNPVLHQGQHFPSLWRRRGKEAVPEKEEGDEEVPEKEKGKEDVPEEEEGEEEVPKEEWLE